MGKTRHGNVPAANKKECSTLIIGTQESKHNNSQPDIEKVRLNGSMINTLGGIFNVFFAKYIPYPPAALIDED